jgi:bifunctional non-homologous end joining protein LigD
MVSERLTLTRLALRSTAMTNYALSLSWPPFHPPGFIASCLPTNRRSVPTGPQWAYEIKHDGHRVICRRDGDRVCVFSRRGNDWTDRVPLIAGALAALRVKSVTIDGEGVVCRPDGVSDFDRLRAAVGRLGSRDAFLCAFDLAGDRRRGYTALRMASAASDAGIAAKASRPRHPLFRASRRQRRARVPTRLLHGPGGIVAKRRDQPYRWGRSPDWIKVKNLDAPAATTIMEWLTPGRPLIEFGYRRPSCRSGVAPILDGREDLEDGL